MVTARKPAAALHTERDGFKLLFENRDVFNLNAESLNCSENK